MTGTRTMTLSRLAGALLLTADGGSILIGNTKEPCDWQQAGFEQPAELQTGSSGVRVLQRIGNPQQPASPVLFVHADGQSAEAVAAILANRFLIRRNSSVSDRLWRIVIGINDESPNDSPIHSDVSWLVAMPEQVWNIVRDAALKCL